MKEFKALCKQILPVGSRVTCNPAPTDTDEDYLCLVEEYKFWKLTDLLLDSGWEVGGSHIISAEEYPIAPEDGFYSFKKGYLNLIITCSEDFFGKFMIATEIAKKENLLLKEDRIALFQHILYGEVS